MNDMTNDTMSDDAVIARLRSALDEVAATGGPITADAPDASVVPLRTRTAGRRPARTWIGVAAATVVLMGGAGWALSQRTSPAATGTDTDTTLDSTPIVTDPTTTASTPSVTDPTATLVTASGDAPWYTVGLADAVPGGISTQYVGDDPTGSTQSWIVSGATGDTSSLGLLIIDTRFDLLDWPPDNNYTEIAAPQGTAWLLTNPASPTSGSPRIIWQRGDGAVWFVTQAGLIDPADADGSAFAEFVFQVEEEESGLLRNPDERAEFIDSSPKYGLLEYKQDYAVGGVDTAIVLGVVRNPPLIYLSEATGITETSIAGNRAWRGTQADGETTVVWDSAVEGIHGPGSFMPWWGVLRISPVLGDRVDEVLASVTMATPSSGPSTPGSIVP